MWFTIVIIKSTLKNDANMQNEMIKNKNTKIIDLKKIKIDVRETASTPRQSAQNTDTVYIWVKRRLEFRNKNEKNVARNYKNIFPCKHSWHIFQLSSQKMITAISRRTVSPLLFRTIGKNRSF